MEQNEMEKQYSEEKSEERNLNHSKDSSIKPEPGDVEQAPKIKACEGKHYGDPCHWTYKGTTYYGHCRWLELAFTPTLYCRNWGK